MLSSKKEYLNRILNCTLLSAAIVMLSSQPVFAGQIETFICTLVSWVSGQMATVVASMVIMIMGLMAFFGRINWGVALVVIAGITIVFGAGTILSLINAGAANTCAAGDDGPIAEALCNIYDTLSGLPAGATSTLVILSVGVTAIVGASQMQWSKALMGTVAIVCLVSAPSIVDSIFEGSVAC